MTTMRDGQIEVSAGDMSSNDPDRYDYLTERYTGSAYKGDRLVASKQFGAYLMQATGQLDPEGDREVVVTLDGKVVADCFFGPQPGNESHIEGAVQVHPHHRRRGIATAMYSWIEALTGKKMAPGAGHSNDAERLWTQPNRAFGSLLDRFSMNYWMNHRPNKDGPPAHDLLAPDPEQGVPLMPADIYDHPEYYCGFREMLPETMRVLKSVRGNPNAQVTIYRAQKAKAGLNTGDWVTLSKAYAQQDLESETASRAVESYRVPAHTVRFAGDDLMEWGYWGPSITGTPHVGGPMNDYIPLRFRSPVQPTHSQMDDPRQVVFDRPALEDIEDLPGDIRSRLNEVLHDLQSGTAEIDAKHGELAGVYTIKVTPRWRAAFYLGVDSQWHCFWVGPHNYDEATKRWTHTASVTTEYLDATTQMQRQMGTQYTSVDQIIRQEGKHWRNISSTLPPGVKRGRMGDCYSNALNAAAADRSLIYVEGYAYKDFFPMQHAWVVDGNGVVYDPTWPEPAREYYGVAFNTPWLLAYVLRSGYSSIFGTEFMHDGLLEILRRGYLPADAINATGSKTAGQPIEYYRLDRGMDFIVARSEGKTIGLLSIGRGTSEVQSLWVAPEFRRRGIATQLWKHGKTVRPNLIHSLDRTDEGDAWARAVGGEQHGGPVGERKYNTTDPGSGERHARMIDGLFADLDDPVWGPRMQKQIIRLAMPSWRDRGARPEEAEALIVPDTGRGRNNSFEVFLYGQPHARRSTLAEAKQAVEEIYGPLEWQKVAGDKDPHHDTTWGPTSMFNDADYYLVVDRLPRLGVTASDTPEIYLRERALRDEGIVRRLTKEQATELTYRTLAAEGFPNGSSAEVEVNAGLGRSMVGWYTDTIPPTPLVVLDPRMLDEMTVLHECAHIIRNGPAMAGRSSAPGTDTHDAEWLATFERLANTYGSYPTKRLFRTAGAHDELVFKRTTGEKVDGFDVSFRGEHIGGISWWRDTKVVSSIVVVEEYQRRGFATAIWAKAKEVEPDLKHDTKQVSDEGRAWIKSMATAVDLDHWRPTGGMFGRGQDTLDPRVFDTQTEEMRPDIHASVMGALDAYWTPQYGDWRVWAKVYLAGSGASYWWDSDADMDILIGVDLDRLREARPANKEVADDEILAHLNKGLKEDLRPTTTALNGFETTWFVNAGAYDILAIHPYAAYDLTGNVWVVKPPVLPANWGPDSIPEETWRRCEMAAREAQEVLSLDEPERSIAGTVYFDWVHEGRRASYSAYGGGWLDAGNVVYQYLSQHPERFLRRLYLCKHPEQASDADAIEVTAATEALPPGTLGSSGFSGVVEQMADDEVEDRGYLSRIIKGVQAFQDGEEVGFLLWNPDNDSKIEEVQVEPQWQRRGVASAMLVKARQIDPNVKHSDTLTDDGEGWSQAVAARTIDMTPPKPAGWKGTGIYEMDLTGASTHGCVATLAEAMGMIWPIGWLTWDKGTHVLEGVWVEESNRGNGIAKDMLEEAEKIVGGKLVDSGEYTPEGLAWAKKRGINPKLKVRTPANEMSRMNAQMHEALIGGGRIKRLVQSYEEHTASKTAAGTTTVYRGLYLELESDDYDRLPGCLVSRVLAGGTDHTTGTDRNNLGTHWTTDRRVAQYFATPMTRRGEQPTLGSDGWGVSVPIIVTARVSSSDVVTDEEELRAAMVEGVGWIGLPSTTRLPEKEVLVRPGAAIEVTDIEALSPSQWWRVRQAVEDMDAGRVQNLKVDWKRIGGGLRAAAGLLDDLPKPLGETPVPSGTIRCYHYTSEANADSIARSGLLERYARGDGNMGAGNEASAGVWAATGRPASSGGMKGASPGQAIVEFWVKPEQVSQRAEYPFNGEDLVSWGNGGYHHIIVTGDVPPRQIVAIHLPWHNHARYMQTNPRVVPSAETAATLPLEYRKAYEFITRHQRG